jgi:uncharacterized membrane protein YccC
MKGKRSARANSTERLPSSRAAEWLKGRRGALALALRTTLAGLITFAVAHLLHLPQAYWAVLTSVIIIQASVGGSLKAGLDRLLGTLAGAVWGAGVMLALPQRSVPELGLALALGLGPLALLAALNPGYRMAPVTAIIVLLASTGSQLGPVRYAIARVLEIGLGCVIGLAASLLILPARADRLLSKAAAEVLLASRELLELRLRDMNQAPDGDALVAARQRLNTVLARMESLVDEVRRERSTRLSDAPDPDPAARTLRRLSHDLSAIGRAELASFPPCTRAYLEEPIAAVRQAVVDYLSAAAAAYGARGAPPSRAAVDRAVLAFHQSLERLRQSGILRELSAEAIAPVFGLAFAIEQLRGDLGDLFISPASIVR